MNDGNGGGKHPGLSALSAIAGHLGGRDESKSSCSDERMNADQQGLQDGVPPPAKRARVENDDASKANGNADKVTNGNSAVSNGGGVGQQNDQQRARDTTAIPPTADTTAAHAPNSPRFAA